MVAVKIGLGDFTIKSTQFTYYLNTKAENTIAYGPGILDCNFIGEDTLFFIQSRNTAGENRTSGADEFIIDIIRPDLIKKADEPQEEPQDKSRPQTREKSQKGSSAGGDKPKEEKKAEGEEQKAGQEE